MSNYCEHGIRRSNPCPDCIREYGVPTHQIHHQHHKLEYAKCELANAITAIKQNRLKDAYIEAERGQRLIREVIAETQPPPAPPVDNRYVADGCEQFSEPNSVISQK